MYRNARAVLEQKVHLIELDLLQGGTRPALAKSLPAGDYFLFLSRADDRPNCEVSHWRLRDPLPTMPIPLQAPDRDVFVDLAKVFATTYTRGRYARSLAYGQAPAAPLRSADASWAKKISARK